MCAATIVHCAFSFLQHSPIIKTKQIDPQFFNSIQKKNNAPSINRHFSNINQKRSAPSKNKQLARNRARKQRIRTRTMAVKASLCTTPRPAIARAPPRPSRARVCAACACVRAAIDSRSHSHARKMAAVRTRRASLTPRSVSIFSGRRWCQRCGVRIPRAGFRVGVGARAGSLLV